MSVTQTVPLLPDTSVGQTLPSSTDTSVGQTFGSRAMSTRHLSNVYPTSQHVYPTFETCLPDTSVGPSVQDQPITKKNTNAWLA